MDNPNCIFCKIAQKTLHSEIIKETEHFIVIKDIAPKAPIHYLIIPKAHIENLLSISPEETEIGKEMLQIAHDLSHILAEPKAFNLVINNGAEAGQKVFHLHVHFIAGKSSHDALHLNL